MNDVAVSFLSGLRVADLLVYVLLGCFGLLGVSIDWFVDDVFLKKARRAFVCPNPFRRWMWLPALFILWCFFELAFMAPAFHQDGRWDFQILALVYPDNFKEGWFVNIFEEVFRFGTFFLLIRFMRPAVAVVTTTLLFILIHNYYDLPSHQALTAYFFAFVLGGLLLFIGLKFGVLAAYVFHVASNTFHLGLYVEAPLGLMWVNWLIALAVLGVASVW